MTRLFKIFATEDDQIERWILPGHEICRVTDAFEVRGKDFSWVVAGTEQCKRRHSYTIRAGRSRSPSRMVNDRKSPVVCFCGAEISNDSFICIFRSVDDSS